MNPREIISLIQLIDAVYSLIDRFNEWFARTLTAQTTATPTPDSVDGARIATDFVAILDKLNEGLADWAGSIERLQVATASMDFASRSLENVYQTFNDLSGEKLAELGRGFTGLAGAFERIDLEQLNAVRDTINDMLDAAMQWRKFELSQPNRKTSDSGQNSEQHAFNGLSGAGANDLLIGSAGSDVVNDGHIDSRDVTLTSGADLPAPQWPWSVSSPQIGETKTALDDLGARLDELDFDWEHTFERMKSVLLDFAETGKFEWRDLAKITLDSIEQMLQGWLKLQQQKMEQGGGESDPWSIILSTAGSALGGLFGGGGVPAGTPTAATTSGFSALLSRAGGGGVSAFSPYLVGERGPELFVPRVPGEIVPNHALGSARGGPDGGRPVIVNLNVSPGVPEAVRREVAALIPQITQAAKLGVASDMDRNGALRRRLN